MWIIYQFKVYYLFYHYFPKYRIEKNELSEFLIFLNSSGVVQKTFCIPINKIIFNLLDLTDRILIFLLPGIFALGRSVVLKKK